MATAGTFLETKLVFRCDKQRLKSLKYAMFKDLGYNSADGYTPEIVASERFVTAFIVEIVQKTTNLDILSPC